MDRYLILLDFQPAKDDAILNLTKCLSEARGWRCPRTDHYYPSQTFVCSLLLPCSDGSGSLQLLDTETGEKKWCEVPECDEDNLMLYLKQLIQDDKQPQNCGTDDLAEQLHNLADSLPQSGYFVDVVWFLENNKILEISENVALYGALKRIIEWHYGQITLLVDDPNNNADLQMSPWVRFLQPAIKSSAARNLVEKFVWRGRINVTDQKSMSSLTMPGFMLQMPEKEPDLIGSSLMKKLFPKSPSPRKALSTRKTRQDKFHSGDREGLCLCGQLEYLEEIEYMQVPSFYVTNVKLELSLVAPCTGESSQDVLKSKLFMDHISRNKHMCSFVRLWYSKQHTKSSKPVKHVDADGKEKTGTMVWQEKILQNEITMPEQPLTGQKDYLTFLLRPGDGDKVYAYLLRQPQEIDGGIVEALIKAPVQVSSDSEGEENVRYLLSQLPSFTPEFLTQINEDVFEVQKTVLQRWIDHQEANNRSAQLTEKELFFLLNTVRENYLSKVQENLQPTELNDVSHLTFKPPPSELDVEPSEWLERYALTERENTEKMQRIKSLDRIGGVPPPPKDHKEDESFKLDAKEFLKLFAPTGAPIAECLSPIRHPKSKSRVKLPKYNSGEVKESDWPKSMKYHYHGVHYNVSSESEQTADRHARIIERYICHETSSTCTNAQKAKPATVAMLTCVTSKPREKKDNLSKMPKTKSSEDIMKERRASLKRGATGKPSVPPPVGKRRSPRYSKDNPSRTGENRSREPSENRSREPSENRRQSQTRNPHPENRGLKETQIGNTQPKPPEKTDAKGKPVEKRSERHKRKLESIVKDVLTKKGMPPDNPAHKACSERLFRVTKAFIMDLKSSWNLAQEMKKIAEEQVQMVIDFELKNRKTEEKR